jgi:hypothetical protein
LEAIHRRFGVPVRLPDRISAKIKAADRIAAYFEATRLAGFSDGEALRYFGRPRGVDPASLPLAPWPAAVAERRYIGRFAVVAAAVRDG